MAKWAAPKIMDAGLELLKSRAARVFLCPAEPATYAEADTARIATVPLRRGDILGPEDASKGRSLRIQVSEPAVAEKRGRVSHIVLADSRRRRIQWITTCDPMRLRRGDRVQLRAWEIGVRGVE